MVVGTRKRKSVTRVGSSPFTERMYDTFRIAVDVIEKAWWRGSRRRSQMRVGGKLAAAAVSRLPVIPLRNQTTK